MKIKWLEIEGFRSFTSCVKVFFEPTVTIVLGANDHGKSNLLLAIQSLNKDFEWDEEADLSWDLEGRDDEYPRITACLELDNDERQLIAGAENKLRKTVTYATANGERVVLKTGAAGNPPQPTQTYVIEATGTPVPASEVRKIETLRDGQTEAVLDEVPSQFTLTIQGCDRVRTIEGFDDWNPNVVQTVIDAGLPRVELIEPYAQVSDAVTWQELKAGKNEFMRGILYYAGLTPDECEGLFEQNDSTTRELDTASEILNKTLKHSWSQGRNLTFRLRHDSKKGAIDLLIQDPAVKRRFVRASRRSSGFTHYFTLKTILYAREQENSSNHRLVLFDEPGIYLHPAGQMDLLRVLREIGRENQVVYVTHSLFMIDKNVPSAHRLLVKGPHGTVVDSKPYTGGWGRAMSALGITLSGSILFASHVLLTEGDSDPIYLYAILAKLNELDVIDLDLNALAIMSTGDGKHADALIRMLTESEPGPRIAYLSDGDPGGNDRVKELAHLFELHQVKTQSLPRNTTIEDHVIGGRKLLTRAAARYAVKLCKNSQGKEISEEECIEKLDEALTKPAESGRNIGGSIKILTGCVAELAGLESHASKVGIAREYVSLLNEDGVKFGKRDYEKAVKLATGIQAILDVPKRTAVDRGIEQEE